MKKAQRKHLFRTIRGNWVSFLAVAVIAAISMGVFLGMQSATDAMFLRAGEYFEENALESLEISCANGITEEDVAAIDAWDGVDRVEGGYTAVVLLDTPQEKILIQARSMLEGMNTPVVLSGALPTKADEAAIEEMLAVDKGVQIGDELVIGHDGNLTGERFRVTAIINDPAFSCADVADARGMGDVGLGSAAYYISLPKAAFDTGYYNGCYTTAYIRNDALGQIYYYSDEYAAAEAYFAEAVAERGAERALLRYNTLMADGQAALADAEEKLAHAQAELNAGERELADGRAALETEKVQLEAAREQIDAALRPLGLEGDPAAALTRLEGMGDAALPLIASITAWQEGEAAVAAAEEELKAADAQIQAGKAELADAQLSLEDARGQVEGIQHREWIVFRRNDIGDVRGVTQIIGALRTLSYFLSLFFMAVAIVVCYTAITRMIDERRELIGAQKALGFTSREVFRHFMLYNIFCALVAVVLGGSIAVLAEFSVILAFQSDFLFDSISLVFRWDLAAVAAALGLVVFIGTTYLACARQVRMSAIELLRGETPARKKSYFFERWKGYQRLSLYSRTMIKNVLSDKGRMITTIIGVVGCIGLLFVCFSLRMSILDSSKTQYARYFLYENRLVIDSARGDRAPFEQALDASGAAYTRVHEKLMSFRVEGESWDSVHLIVPENFAELKPFIHLEDIETGAAAAMPQEGFLISRKCAELYGLSIGDTVELMDAGGNRYEAAVAGVIEHYLPFHLFVSSAPYYEQLTGEAADQCVYLLSGSIEGLHDQVAGLEGFISLKDNSEFAADASVYDMVIAICLGLSAVMAFLVLLNQAVMHINRKAKELAVMRINGYTLKETKAFIYKENIVLTVLGLILGCAVGTVLAYMVICIAEVGAARNVRIPSVTAVLFSCAVGSFFAWVVNVIALRRIHRLKLTNINGN